MIRPPALGPGARVALVAPAGPLPEGAVDRAVERVRSWGWEPLPGEFCRGRRGFLSGTDDERLADFQAALRSPDNDAVWCLRGGYGTMRILGRIDWAPLAERPRPLIGFSDNTALHLALFRRGVVSFHGPHPATPELPEFSRDALLRTVARAEPAGVLPFPAGGPARADTLAGGVAEGPLVGGNLALLAAMAGTPWALRAEGALLFVEDVGEAAYRVDRLVSQLLLSGALDGVAGVVVGDFSEAPDEGREGIPTAAEVIAERVAPLGVPVAAGFPFGHVDLSWTLPLGVRARVDADAGTLELLEPAVRAAGDDGRETT
ncbi:MAG TPA: LD-carboxypeptidase [Longimicrobiaceae bacterium]|nr:LD-carboxypeptidase [Longimicrobiaceae bacterium]